MMMMDGCMYVCTVGDDDDDHVCMYVCMYVGGLIDQSSIGSVASSVLGSSYHQVCR